MMRLFGPTTPITFTDNAGHPQMGINPPPDDAPPEQWLDFASVIGLGQAIGTPSPHDAVAIYNRVVQAYLWKWADYEPFTRGPSKPWPPEGTPPEGAK